MRCQRDGKVLVFDCSRYVTQTGPTALGVFFIVRDYFINCGVILQKLAAHWQAQNAQFFYRKAPANFADERQRQYRVAQETSLQNQHIIPTDPCHILLQWKSLIDQHYRDVVLDWIDQSTGVANQTIFGRVEMDIAFAFRTSENVQELFANRHRRSPPYIA